MTPVREPRPARTGAGASALTAGLGALLGGLLWLAWVPTTRACDNIGECLSRPFAALILTALAVLASLLVLRLLRIRPVFLTTLFGFVGAGALILTLTEVLDGRDPDLHQPMSPWWTWVVLGGLLAALAHWVNQPGRRWVARVVPVVVVLVLVVSGTTWVQHERSAQALRELQAVGVDRVVVPQVPGHELTSSWPRTGADWPVPMIVLNYSAVADSAPFAGLEGYLIPLAGRSPCEVVREVATGGPQDCTGDPDAVEATWSGPDGTAFQVGAGTVVGDTLVFVTGTSGMLTIEQLRAAVDDAAPATLEELRDV